MNIAVHDGWVLGSGNVGKYIVSLRIFHPGRVLGYPKLHTLPSTPLPLQGTSCQGVITGVHNNQDLICCVEIGVYMFFWYLVVHSSQDLICCVEIGVYMGFWVPRGP